MRYLIDHPPDLRRIIVYDALMHSSDTERFQRQSLFANSAYRATSLCHTYLRRHGLSSQLLDIHSTRLCNLRGDLEARQSLQRRFSDIVRVRRAQ